MNEQFNRTNELLPQVDLLWVKWWKEHKRRATESGVCVKSFIRPTAPRLASDVSGHG